MNESLMDYLRPWLEKINTLESNANAFMEYFALKNKVLWEGSKSSGVLTIPNGALYSSFIFEMGSVPIYVYSLRDSSLYGIGGNSSSAVHVTREISLSGGSVNGNDLVFNTFVTNALIHNSSGNHGAVTVNSITKIIGLEPKLPDNLQTLINSWGGVVQAINRLFRRWCYV